MTDERDLERRLRAFRHRADPRKRDVVMRAVAARATRSPRAGSGFWRRPIPLHAVAIALVVVMSLAFAAGLSAGGREDGARRASAPYGGWALATGDVLADRRSRP